MLDMDIREYGTCRDKFSAISENRFCCFNCMTLIFKKWQKEI